VEASGDRVIELKKTTVRQEAFSFEAGVLRQIRAIHTAVIQKKLRCIFT